MGAHVTSQSGDVNIGISSEARQVYALLPRMSASELADVVPRLRALGASSPGVSADDTDEPVDWLLAGIERELRRRGLLTRGARLPVDRIYPKYKQASKPARRALERALGKNPRPERLAALGALAAECLADYVEALPTKNRDGNWTTLSVSPRTMLRHASEAMAAVDAAFPGYAPSGTLGMCLRGR